MPFEEGLDLEGGIYLNSSIPYHYIHSTCSTHIDSGLRSQPTPVRQPSTNRHVERSGPKDWVARQIRIWRWTIDDLTGPGKKRRLCGWVGYLGTRQRGQPPGLGRPSGNRRYLRLWGPRAELSACARPPLAEEAASGGSASRPSAVPSDRARLCRARRYIGEGTMGTYPPPIYREISTATRLESNARTGSLKLNLAYVVERCVCVCMRHEPATWPQQRPPVMSWLVGGAFFEAAQSFPSA